VWPKVLQVGKSPCYLIPQIVRQFGVVKDIHCMRDDVSKSLFGDAYLIMSVCNGELQFDAFRSPLILHLV
jgi:hypothetical protein